MPRKRRSKGGEAKTLCPPVGVRLTPAEIAELDALAARYGVLRSDLIRLGVRFALRAAREWPEPQFVEVLWDVGVPVWREL